MNKVSYFLSKHIIGFNLILSTISQLNIHIILMKGSTFVIDRYKLQHLHNTIFK